MAANERAGPPHLTCARHASRSLVQGNMLCVPNVTHDKEHTTKSKTSFPPPPPRFFGTRMRCQAPSSVLQASRAVRMHGRWMRANTKEHCHLQVAGMLAAERARQLLLQLLTASAVRGQLIREASTSRVHSWDSGLHAMAKGQRRLRLGMDAMLVQHAGGRHIASTPPVPHSGVIRPGTTHAAHGRRCAPHTDGHGCRQAIAQHAPRHAFRAACRPAGTCR